MDEGEFFKPESIHVIMAERFLIRYFFSVTQRFYVCVYPRAFFEPM